MTSVLFSEPGKDRERKWAKLTKHAKIWLNFKSNGNWCHLWCRHAQLYMQNQSVKIATYDWLGIRCCN